MIIFAMQLVIHLMNWGLKVEYHANADYDNLLKNSEK